MTESLKLADIHHRANIDYERQRHLVNWLIKSGPHMNGSPPSGGGSAANSTATTNAQLLQSVQPNGVAAAAAAAVTAAAPVGMFVGGGGGGVKSTQTPGAGQSTAAAAATTTAPLVACPPAAAVAMSRASFYTSQANLPLHMSSSGGGGGGDGAHPKLRRFNSHDTSANMFSVADFENARLARRNEMEIKQRQQQRYKMNSLSSGTGDCSTGDSKGSKFSSDSSSDPMPAEQFLDRFALPRVVRVSSVAAGCGASTIQSSSSNGSLTSDGRPGRTTTTTTATASTAAVDKGELCMLYKQVKNRKIYHGYNAKSGASRKKGVMIPQEYQGYFSLVSEKGSMLAAQYTTLVQLVRERVYKFLSVDNMPAYTETHSTDTYPQRAHYVKGTAHGGQIYRLLAVFEDGKQDSATTSSSTSAPFNVAVSSDAAAGNNSSTQSNAISSGIFRDKDKGRYAQLLNENRQIMYVSLTAKGKFYEIEPNTPQIFQKSTDSAVAAANAGRKTPAAINTDCVYRLEQLIAGHAQPLPLNVRLVSAPAATPQSIANGAGSVPVPDHLIISHVSSETLLIVCPIDESVASDGRATVQTLRLRKLSLRGPLALLFGKSTLGFESEQKMFLNPSVQTILKYCQLNVGAFMRIVTGETRLVKHGTIGGGSGGGGGGGSKPKSEGGIKILRPLNFPRLLRREKSTVAHEKEDSIIFLSKNDLENMDQLQHQQQQQHQTDGESPVQQQIGAQTPNVVGHNNAVATAANVPKKKWFRKSSTATKSMSQQNLMLIDAQTKRMSMDRYQDMSKLLHERFGDADGSGLVAATDSQQTAGNNHGRVVFDELPAALAEARQPQRVRPTSEIGAAETANGRRQKSISLQDMQDVVSTTTTTTTTTSPLGRPIDDDHNVDDDDGTHSLQNFTAAADDRGQSSGQPQQQRHQRPLDHLHQHQQQSFISAKLYTEFHVKTKQHSKSSSHLHSLLHFSVPQKMHISEVVGNNRTQSQGQQQQQPSVPIDLRDLQTSATIDADASWSASAVATTSVHTTTIDDDMPYSNVRDTLVSAPMPSAGAAAAAVGATANGRTARHMRSIVSTTSTTASSASSSASSASTTAAATATAMATLAAGSDDSLPENIYAEICGAPMTTAIYGPASGVDATAASNGQPTMTSSIVNSRAAGSTIRISVPAIRSPLMMASVVGVQHPAVGGY